MKCSMSGFVRRTHIQYLAAVLITTLAAAVSQAQGGSSYQTRLTEQPPNAARHRHVALTLGNGSVGVFGGSGRTDAELFDPATERFTLTPAMRAFGDFAGAVLPDGNVLLVDGRNDCVFDYVLEEYVDTVGLYGDGSVRFPVLVPLADGKVFISGGWDADFEPKGTCGLYDPRGRQFQPLGDLVVPRARHSAVLFGERYVLIIGGYGYSDGSPQPVALDSVELFDIYTGWSARIRTPMRQARRSHSSVQLPDGLVLILGGTSSEREPPLRSTEIFNPHTAVFSEGPDLGLRRSGAQTAVMPSGRIAIFGGNPDGRVVELYCPATGTLELADSLTLDPRWVGFTATSLDSGAVLLVGGRVNEGAEVVASAEIFQEIATETPSGPPMTAASIRELLTDRNLNVVAQTTEWLVALGPQVRPILETLRQDASPELAGRIDGILQSIETSVYPETWCVEIWDARGMLGAIWLVGYDSPDSFNPVFPHQHFNDIVRRIGWLDFTHLVVRFPKHTPYEARVRLFNLVGWTRVPKVVLGESLDAADWDKR